MNKKDTAVIITHKINFDKRHEPTKTWLIIKPKRKTHRQRTLPQINTQKASSINFINPTNHTV
ncbi:hypothetical protein E6P70_06560 [Moraxella nonliquefaciens]|uniref:hypothetical protein n=1 Tax=Moraxella nonliquefaciens TaxID=478 RepID=UPI0024A76C8E|nr:hypothetical protein [Moraxella nonliquefaciens]MDI4498583.1 hypothetical protein [Moraxella nonliquefaciens]MDI4500266.1 hypothetical protein [Moraxella nonliquefaciens]